MKRTALWVSVLCMVMMLALRGQAEGCLTVGDSVVFGHLEQDDDAANGSEPLTWTVLHTEDDKALLITAEVIASRQFHNRWLDTTWEASQLRAWLNDTLYTEAFTPEEQACMLVTRLETPDNTSYHTSGGNPTEDRLFLLSVEEAREYLPSAKARKAVGTAAAEAQQLYVMREGANAGCCWWWLRTMGQTGDTAVFVKEDGTILFKGYDVDFFSGGVRPAVWVDMGRWMELTRPRD